MCVCVFCWRNGALTCRYVQCDRARQNEEYMICICTCVCVYWCIMCLGRGGGCVAALSLAVSLFLGIASSCLCCAFVPLHFADFLFYLLLMPVLPFIHLQQHQQQLLIWGSDALPPAGEKKLRVGAQALNWTEKGNKNKICIVLLHFFLLPISLCLSFFVTFVHLSCCCRSFLWMFTLTHTCTNVPKCIVYVWVCVCVCICSCSCRCRLEKTTIASPGKWFRRRRKFNMPYLYFLYALVWALFCAALRSASALPSPCRSLPLFLFLLSFVSICIWL